MHIVLPACRYWGSLGLELHGQGHTYSTLCPSTARGRRFLAALPPLPVLPKSKTGPPTSLAQAMSGPEGRAAPVAGDGRAGRHEANAEEMGSGFSVPRLESGLDGAPSFHWRRGSEGRRTRRVVFRSSSSSFLLPAANLCVKRIRTQSSLSRESRSTNDEYFRERERDWDRDRDRHKRGGGKLGDGDRTSASASTRGGARTGLVEGEARPD